MEKSPNNKIQNWNKPKPKNTRTLWQKLRGNDPPLPQGTMKKYGKQNNKKKTQKGSALPAAPEYLLRAANMLSERSNKIRNANLKLVTKNNRRMLNNLLKKTRKNRNNH